MDTQYSKDRDGHRAKTHIDLADRRVLIIDTRKSTVSKRLTTRASVHLREETGVLSHRIGFGGPCGDYSRVIFNESVRVTGQAVREQHQRALGMY